MEKLSPVKSAILAYEVFPKKARYIILYILYMCKSVIIKYKKINNMYKILDIIWV